MIIAYHAVFTTYGTWLPNDPRGSFSKAIYNPYLRALGGVQYGRQDPQPEKGTLLRFWRVSRDRLSRPPYFIDDRIRPVVAAAFDEAVRRFRLAVCACAILNDHVHLLVMRSQYRIEHIVAWMKGAATHALGLEKTPWTENCGKVFIDDAETLRAAKQYVEDNPRKAGLAPQRWAFVRELPVKYRR